MDRHDYAGAESVVVTGLFHYPVKSCRGTALTKAAFDARGIAHDREFVIAEPDGAFLTQRQEPTMALIQPVLTDDGLTLSAPGMAPCRVVRHHDGDGLTVTIWKDTVAAVDQGDEVADWLSAYLGRPARLARMADDHIRRVDPAYARPEDQTGFADGYPALLIAEESLAELNRRLTARGEAPLPMNRFRPNIVVRGAGPPHAEDDWRDVRIGSMTFHGVKLCARCAITTTDQETAETGKEPLRTFATYRKQPRGVMFGQNLTFDAPGTIAVGDAVEIVHRAALVNA